MPRGEVIAVSGRTGSIRLLHTHTNKHTHTNTHTQTHTHDKLSLAMRLIEGRLFACYCYISVTTRSRQKHVFAHNSESVGPIGMKPSLRQPRWASGSNEHIPRPIGPKLKERIAEQTNRQTDRQNQPFTKRESDGSGNSQQVTHASANRARRCLTPALERVPVFQNALTRRCLTPAFERVPVFVLQLFFRADYTTYTCYSLTERVSTCLWFAVTLPT